MVFLTLRRCVDIRASRVFLLALMLEPLATPRTRVLERGTLPEITRKKEPFETRDLWVHAIPPGIVRRRLLRVGPSLLGPRALGDRTLLVIVELAIPLPLETSWAVDLLWNGETAVVAASHR